MVRHIEHLPNINPDPIGVPDALFLRPSVVAVLDGAKGEVILVSPFGIPMMCLHARPMRRRQNGLGTRCGISNVLLAKRAIWVSG